MMPQGWQIERDIDSIGSLQINLYEIIANWRKD